METPTRNVTVNESKMRFTYFPRIQENLLNFPLIQWGEYIGNLFAEILQFWNESHTGSASITLAPKVF